MENTFMFTVVATENAGNDAALYRKLSTYHGVKMADISKTEGRIYVRGEEINCKVISQLIEQNGYTVISESNA